MTIEHVQQLKEKLENEIKAAALKFEEAVKGNPVFLKTIKVNCYTIEDRFVANVTANIQVEI